MNNTAAAAVRAGADHGLPHRGNASALHGGPQRQQRRLRVLAWAFALVNSARVLAYLPTILAIHHSGNADQHSLWTWCTFCAANVTMAAWLYENNDQQIDRAVVVTLGNAAMCAAIVGMILAYRWPLV